MNDFRAILRQETADAHAELDAALIEYDLTTRVGLASYLSVHHVARDALSPTFQGHDGVRNTEILNDIKHDLAILGSVLPKNTVQARTDLHPLGLSYVIAGSSLGSKVLFKEWHHSKDPRVMSASKFMTSSKNSTDWLAFLKKTDSLQLSKVELSEAIDSANAVFLTYSAANIMIKTSLDD